jgi:hypothetical protein
MRLWSLGCSVDGVADYIDLIKQAGRRPMTSIEVGIDIDLSEYEPEFEGSDDGLIVRGYEVDGQFLLDFDWEPDSKWAFLDDKTVFEEFVLKFLEQLSGETLTSEEVESLEVKHAPAQAMEVEQD